MAIDHHKGHLKIIRSALSTVVYPLQYVVNLPIEATEWLSNSLITRKNLLDENERLKQDHLLCPMQRMLNILEQRLIFT